MKNHIGRHIELVGNLLAQIGKYSIKLWVENGVSRGLNHHIVGFGEISVVHDIEFIFAIEKFFTFRGDL